MVAGPAQPDTVTALAHWLQVPRWAVLGWTPWALAFWEALMERDRWS